MDFFSDLGKELDAYEQRRAGRRGDGGDGGVGSIWEEFAAFGEEFLEFLEENLPEETQSRAAREEGARPAAGETKAAPPPPRQPSMDVDEVLAQMKRDMGLD